MKLDKAAPLARSSWLLSSCATLALAAAAFGCEEEKPAPAPVAELVPTTEPAAAIAEPKEPEKAERPKNVSMDLTSERRSAVEKAHPESKGFLFANEIEEKLKKDKSNTAKAPALKSFDKLAKGKWVLFVGTLINPTETGFDMAVSYTPLDPNDRMGISRQFFTVTFSQIEGYAQEGFKAGNTVAVVAKYAGASAAGPGFELVADKSWQ